MEKKQQLASRMWGWGPSSFNSSTLASSSVDFGATKDGKNAGKIHGTYKKIHENPWKSMEVSGEIHWNWVDDIKISGIQLG